MCPHTIILSIERSVCSSLDAPVRMDCVGRWVVQTKHWERMYEEVCLLESRTMFAYVYCSLMYLVGASIESCDASCRSFSLLFLDVGYQSKTLQYIVFNPRHGSKYRKAVRIW